MPHCRYRPRVDIDWNAELVDQLEWHWQHQLRPRLDGLTDDEYFWQPVPGCWAISLRGAGEFTMDYATAPHDREPVTTIAWRLAPHRRIRATAGRSGLGGGGRAGSFPEFGHGGNACGFC